MQRSVCIFTPSLLIVSLSWGACSHSDAPHSKDGDDAEHTDDGPSTGDGDDDNHGHGDGDGDEPARSVTLTFRAQLGDELFACGETYPGQGSSQVAVTPQDFRFYVSEVRLINDTGDEVPVRVVQRSPWQSPTVALLDFEDGSAGCKNGNAAMNSTVTGTVPEGNYLGVVFSTAVPLDLNHEDPATLPDPLQAGGMTWGWLFGYKFIRAEVAATAQPQKGQDPGVGVFHLGSTGCDNEPADGAGGAGGAGPNFGAPPRVACIRQNRTEIRLEDGYSVDEDVIVADLGAIMKNTDLSKSTWCHASGESCRGFFDSVGLDFITGDQLAEQTVFRIASK